MGAGQAGWGWRGVPGKVRRQDAGFGVGLRRLARAWQPTDRGVSTSCGRSLVSQDKYRAIIGQGEMRIPADLPQVAVRVGEITTMPAPKDILGGLDDLPA